MSAELTDNGTGEILEGIHQLICKESLEDLFNDLQGIPLEKIFAKEEIGETSAGNPAETKKKNGRNSEIPPEISAWIFQ